MASSRYASYLQEEDWDLETLEVVNSHLLKYVKMMPAAAAAELTLAELQEVAARQRQAVDSHHQALQAREARLRLLQQQEARHRQLATEAAPRLQRTRDKVEAQELKLRRLRALKGQVEQCRSASGALHSELDAVRALFNEKEKELALAVSRVDTLMKQLQDLREVKVKGGHHLSPPGGEPGGVSLNLELERLKQELVHRNKVNEQKGQQLSTKRQLLQQRKEESSRMDERIHELQQRLKKRRAQEQQQQQHPQPDSKAKEQSAGSSDPSSAQGRSRPRPNVAAVEPYIQYAPDDVVKDDLYSRTGPGGGGFLKQDPKYQTLPPNTKFVPGGGGGGGVGGDEGSNKLQPWSGKTVIEEVNNNNNNSNNNSNSENKSGVKGGVVGGGGGGVKAVEYKIPVLISSHFSAHRGGQGSSPASRTTTTTTSTSGQAAAVVGNSKGPASSDPSKQNSSGASTASHPQQQQQQQHVSKLPKGPRPFVNTFGKSGLPKWPPDPKKEEDEEEEAPPTKPAPLHHHHQQPPHHPQISIFDEERQAGSGQSSPASSEGSGPLVKQGSGVFVHPLATPSQNPPAASHTHAGGGGGGGPQQDSSEQSGGSSVDNGAHEPQPPPPPRVPQSASSVSSTDQSSSSGQQGVVGAGTGSSEDPDSSRGNESSSASTPQVGSQATPAPQGGGSGKTGGSVMHLNQRPAPTYRYASKNVIANTYMGRLGSSALERYQQLNKQLYSAVDPHQGGSNNNQVHQTQQAPSSSHKAGPHGNRRTLAGELRTAFSHAQTPHHQHHQPDSAASGSTEQLNNVAVAVDGDDGQQGGGMTQFGLVGAPSYPDIASDKGSFKANTPKHIRRRHSDSDNEDAAGKPFFHHRGGAKAPQQQQPQPAPPGENFNISNSATTNSSAANEESKSSNSKVPQKPDSRSGSVGGRGNGSTLSQNSGGRGNGSTLSQNSGVRGNGSTLSQNSGGRGNGSTLSQENSGGRGNGSTLSQNSGGRGNGSTLSQENSGGTDGGKGAEQQQQQQQKKKKKTILKVKGDSRGRKPSSSGHRVSFDPLALLLDASLEGELDLVTRTAKEVADVSTPNDEGITALHNAICAGHYEIVKFLIQFGADVNSPDSDGWTPLHCAASCNNVAMVRLLVEHGACILATTISDNETAAEKCEEDEDGYDRCSDYLYSTQEKLGIANDGVVYAVFDYYASSHDEVTFHINDKLTVLRKGDEVEREWWWARLTPNKEGYIPRNLLGLYPRVLSASLQPHGTSDC
ncbi:uncharacterized protein LOC143296025 isoform X1 [Babylonia areolata]|uniref:uncharacterized protein LOC143296025 isoform X1 n=2 Tax=Babylonia areolata TaxID=304850 RepID=UPI003FD2647E